MKTQEAPSPEQNPEAAPPEDAASIIRREFAGETTSPEEAAPEEGTVAADEASDFTEDPTLAAIFDMAGVAAPAEDAALGEGSAPATDEPEPPKEGEEDFPSDVKTEAARSSFAKMRHDLKAARADTEAARKEAAEAANSQVDAQELTELREQHEVAMNELRIARVEATPEYEAAVTTPLRSLGQTVQGLAKKLHPDDASEATSAARVIFKALAEADESKRGDLLSDVTADFNDYDRSRIYRLGEEYQQITETRGSIRADSKGAWERLEKEKSTQETAARESSEKAMTAALDDLGEKLGKNIPFMKEIEGNEDWNKDIKGLHEFVREVQIENLPPANKAEVLYRAGMAPIFFKLFTNLSSEHAKLKAALGKYTKGRPGAGGGGEAAPAPTEKPGTTFSEAIRAGMTS